MNTWQQIIKNKMKESNETQESIAEKMGCSQGSVAHWLSGRRKPDTDIISNLMKAVGLKSFTLNNDGTASEEISIENKSTNPDLFSIEVFDISASAGHGSTSSDVKEVIKLIEYDKGEAFALFGNVKAHNIKVINISGDSMEPTFESGDSIFIDVSRTEFEGDGMYVFTFNNGLFVKRLQLIKGSYLKVLSDNPVYTNWDIQQEEYNQLYIHGKVMFSQSMKLKKFG